MMARLPAFRVNRIAKLCLVPAAERVQVIEQHRNPQPMWRTHLNPRLAKAKNVSHDVTPRSVATRGRAARDGVIGGVARQLETVA
jgi:hypothetical protein